MAKDDSWEELGAIAIGILGGIALLEFLKNRAKKRCPRCNNLNEPTSDRCGFCGSWL